MCWAGDVLEDLDALGSQEAFLEKAESLNPQSRVRIVQKRLVDRFNRHEISPEVGMILGGNSYIQTSFFSFAYQYHLTPHWSLGFSYKNYLNKLTAEGEELINKATDDLREDKFPSLVPELNWPKCAYMAQLNWYPIYGKLNIYDQAVIHFDMYTLLGGGQMALRKGSSTVYQVGGGIGIWLFQYMTAHLEYKYQSYAQESYTGKENVFAHDVGLSIGLML